LLSYDYLDIEKFLVRDGLVMFFLHSIFDKNTHIKVKFEVARLLKMKIEFVEDEVGAYLPIKFFTHMCCDQPDPVEVRNEMIDSFLKNLNKDYYANQFLVWNSQLKET
jgi:hypothetical protein